MREMRRTDRLISKDEAMEILKKGEYGILATADENGQPYGVPLSYALLDDIIYFHATNAGGLKFDNFTTNSKVSFTVVGDTQMLPEKFGTLFENAIIFGEVSQVDDESERYAAFRQLVNKYCADFIPEGEQYIKNAGPRAIIAKISINEISGKARR